MRMRNLLVAGALSGLLFQPASAGADICRAPDLVSAFSNGIQNDRKQAIESHIKLLKTAGPLGFNAGIMLYHTNGRVGNEAKPVSFLLDTFEVFLQLSRETRGNAPGQEAEAMRIFHGYRSAESRPSTFYQNILKYVEQARDATETKAFGINTTTSLADTVSADVALLTARLRKGDMVMVAAHSQGTLWANAALRRLQTEDPVLARRVRLASAGMAASYVWQTPDSALPNHYVTNENDLVIGAVRQVAGGSDMPRPLPSNAVHSYTLDEPLGHAFDKIYLDTAEQTGRDFLKLYVGGVAQLRSETPQQAVLANYDITVDQGYRLSPLVEKGRVYGASSPSRMPNGLWLQVNQVYLGGATVRFIGTWYCPSPGFSLPAGDVQVPLTIIVSQQLGEPTLLTGGIRMGDASYEVQRFGIGTYSPIDQTAWRFATMTLVDAPGGRQLKLVLD